jgi:superfamily II RNA helicase
VEDADPENLLRCSFHQYQQEMEAPALETKAQELQREAGLIVVAAPVVGSSSSSAGAQEDLEEQVSEYESLRSSLQQVRSTMRDTVMNPENCRPYFNAGRFVGFFHCFIRVLMTKYVGRLCDG